MTKRKNKASLYQGLILAFTQFFGRKGFFNFIWYVIKSHAYLAYMQLLIDYKNLPPSYSWDLILADFLLRGSKVPGLGFLYKLEQRFCRYRYNLWVARFTKKYGHEPAPQPRSDYGSSMIILWQYQAEAKPSAFDTEQ